MTIAARIKIILAFAAVITLAIGWVHLQSLEADKARLISAVELAHTEAAGLRDTLAMERARWRSATMAITTATKAQSAVCRTNAERHAQIDIIGRETKAIERPKGSIDEQTSRKVVNIFNDSLFTPLGIRVRRQAD